MHLETSLLQRCSESERQYSIRVDDSATLAWRISSGGRGESIDHSPSTRVLPNDNEDCVQHSEAKSSDFCSGGPAHINRELTLLASLQENILEICPRSSQSSHRHTFCHALWSPVDICLSPWLPYSTYRGALERHSIKRYLMSRFISARPYSIRTEGHAKGAYPCTGYVNVIRSGTVYSQVRPRVGISEADG
jgi:hypothetical protein